MEEKKEWHIMRAEPVKETTVEIPNLWGALGCWFLLLLLRRSSRSKETPKTLSGASSDGGGEIMVKKNERPRGWYLREQKKELRHKITLAKRWIEQCTDSDRLADLKEHLWRLEYRELFLGGKKK